MASDAFRMEKVKEMSLRGCTWVLVTVMVLSACGNSSIEDMDTVIGQSQMAEDPPDNDPPIQEDSELTEEIVAVLYAVVAAAVINDHVDGDTVWFYETEAMTAAAQIQIKAALEQYTVFFGPDWAEVISCRPAGEGPVPVVLTINDASIQGSTAEIAVSYDNPVSFGDGVVVASFEQGTRRVDEINYGPHGDKAWEHC